MGLVWGGMGCGVGWDGMGWGGEQGTRGCRHVNIYMHLYLDADAEAARVGHLLPLLLTVTRRSHPPTQSH
jgi:hypothetical protein